MTAMDICLEFSGGAELLFDNQKKKDIKLDIASGKQWTIKCLLAWIKV